MGVILDLQNHIQKRDPNHHQHHHHHLCVCGRFFLFASLPLPQRLSAMALVLESAPILRDQRIPASVLRSRLSLPRSTGGLRVAFPSASRRSTGRSSVCRVQSSSRSIVCEQQKQNTLAPGTENLFLRVQLIPSYCLMHRSRILFLFIQ
jgi:hypothetical protein